MTPNWPKRYLKAIESGKIPVSRKVAEVYRREVAWMTKPPDDPNFIWHFSAAAGQHHIDFMQNFCKQSKGSYGGKNISFMLFQLAKMQLVFGWVDDQGNRRFREIIDVRARKNGKSTEAAALCHDLLLDDGESGPEIYVVANSRDQAKDGVFTEAVNMRQQSPALRSLERKRQSDIYCAQNFGKIKALAAKTDNLDGLNASLVIQDEWHEQQNSALYDIMKQSQIFRDQPLYWLISTNGFRREAFFDEKYEEGSRIALWEEGFRTYRVLALIYELDSREEWLDEPMWIKANPGLGVIKKIETLREHVEQAKRDPTFLATVLTKDFNVPETSVDAWLSYDDIVNHKVASQKLLNNSYAVGGCDLSATTDLTCATLLILKPDDENLYVLQKYFLPQSKLDELQSETDHPKEAPYKKWVEQGWIIVCPGARVDYHAVTKWFYDMAVENDIRPLWVFYDAALSGYWVPEMEECGFDMESVRQGPFTWTYPMKQLGAAFQEHRVIYQNNPVLRWCLSNTCKKTTNKDGIESIQPVKASTKRRIDGMVSLLNAFTGYAKHADEIIPYLR